MKSQQMYVHWDGMNKKLLLLALLLVVGVVTSMLNERNAHAAQALQTLVRFDRITTSTQTTGTVCLKTTASGSSESYVKVTFPTGYTLGAFGTFTVGTTNTGWPSGASAWTSIAAPTGAGDISGQTVKFGSGALADSTLYCFNWTSATAVQTASGTSTANTGNVETYTSGNALIDHGDYAAPTVTSDSINVTASVPTGFSYTLTGTSDSLPTLDSASVKTSSSPSTVAVSTNAANGWLVWGKDSNAGLTSTIATHTIPTNCSAGAGSNTTLASGAEHFNTGVGITGTGTVATIFDHASTNYKGGGLCQTNQILASDTALSTGTTLTIYNSASISAVTPPASDYTDVITITGAGLF